MTQKFGIRALAAAALGLATAGAPTLADAACGDLNTSGGVPNVADVVVLLRGVLGADITTSCGGAGGANCGDINADNGLTISDAVILLNNVLGNETLYPICVGEGPTIDCPSGGVRVIEDAITSNQVWQSSCTYKLDGTIFVEAGVVLKIQAGTTIKGIKDTANPPSAIIFKRDSKINAIGTSANPIVLTSDQPAGTRVPGDWGGIAFNGRGPVNCGQNECLAEGLENVAFGGNETNDSSGVARYIRVEFAGAELTTDNELNLWTMNGLGRGTTFDHIQAHMGLDDGHEWFGGNLNTKYMIASGAADDSFDWQIGYTGTLQYGYVKQYDGNIDTLGSRGFEGDNNEFGFNLLPRSDAKMCNVTLIGTKGQAGDTNNDGMLFRRGTLFKAAKVITTNFKKSGWKVNEADTMNLACNSSAAVTGGSYVRDSIFYNNSSNANPLLTAGGSSSAIAGGNCTSTSALETKLIAAGYDITIKDPTIEAACSASGFSCNPVPATPATVADSFDCKTIDAAFDTTDYVGGFNPNAASWASGNWVAYPVN